MIARDQLGMILILIFKLDTPGAPQNVQITDYASTSISLSWSPPLVSERLGLRLFNYVINCSTDHSLQENVVLRTERLNLTVDSLHPFTPYNCCVAVNSTHGLGQLACYKNSLITWVKGESCKY